MSEPADIHSQISVASIPAIVLTEGHQQHSSSWVTTGSATTVSRHLDFSEELQCLKELCQRLEDKLDAIQANHCPYVAQLASLGNPDFTLIRPIPVTIYRDGDGFEASFLDANVSAGGETEQVAVFNLQSLLVDYYRIHEQNGGDKLGPLMKVQRNVLMELICRSTNKMQSKQ